jgi:galactokinase
LAAVRRFHAPGRVNVIGEHTDYSGGLALPCAIDRGVTFAVAGPARRIRVRSESEDETVELGADGSGEAAGWARYVAAVAAELAAVGRPPVGLDGRLDSDLPPRAGLSSSAALAVALALGMCAVAEFSLGAEALVRLCQRAERRAVGVPLGPLDQAASLLGRAGELVLLDCETLAHEPVPFPSRLALVVIDSATPRELASSGYAARRAELERAIDAVGASPARLDLERLDVRRVDRVGSRRLRHVVGENERVRRAAALLRDPGGVDVAGLGRLLLESHASLRDLYEVSTGELDLLVELAVEEGAAGARMMGGGFGGSVLALAGVEEAADLGARVAARYRTAHPGLDPAVLVCHPADGAREL